MGHVKIAAYQATLRHYGLLKAALSLTDPRVIGGAIGTVSGGLGGYFTAPKDATTKQKMMRAAGGGALGGASGVAVGHGVHWLRNRPVYRLDQPPAWVPGQGTKPTDEEFKKWMAWDKGTAKERALVEAKALAKAREIAQDGINRHHIDYLNYLAEIEGIRRDKTREEIAKVVKDIPNYRPVKAPPVLPVMQLDFIGDHLKAQGVNLEGVHRRQYGGILDRHVRAKAEKEAERIWGTYKPK